ncbi:AAA domain-containing protein [Vibrio antiquarius]|uniref:AAA domain-containing protein n=1 Tax=Vibrio antiquarius (strain Ex25) TaxID=150340 RepID=UPI00349FEE51
MIGLINESFFISSKIQRTTMKLDIRSPQGIHATEHKAITELAAGLRPSWYGYASFLIADRAGSMEIDLLILTHSRILLVEVKHWSGTIESDGKTWRQTKASGQSRTQASPVTIKREHAQRLSSLFDKHLKSRWNCYYPIETCVVLSGEAEIVQMPEWERQMVFTLEEFLEIRSEKGFERLLPKREHERMLKSGKLLRPNTDRQVRIFENWLNGGGCIKPRQREAGGYVMTDPTPVFQHKSGIYSEYIGEHRNMGGNQALLRAWDFNQLGGLALTQEQRAFLGLREQRAINYVGQKDYQLRKDYLMQPQQQLTKEEVTEDLIEVYEKPPLFERLDEYLVTVSHEKEKRLELLRALLVPFASLHTVGLAHRDIAYERLYYNHQSQSITVSGLVAARFPDPQNRSVGDLREKLATSAIPLPEEIYGEIEIDACKIDVYLLGVIAYRIAFDSTLPVTEDGISWKLAKKDPFDGELNNWLTQALSLDPAERQADAGEMLSQLTELFALDHERSSGADIEIMSALEAFRSPINLMVDFPPLEAPSQDFDRSRMTYKSSYEGKPVIVRIWTGLQPQVADAGQNRRLIRFIERCQLLHQHTLPIPNLIGFGFSMMGLYTIQEYLEEGEVLSNWENVSSVSGEEELTIVQSLINAVNKLHATEVGHGDLKPENILLQSDRHNLKINFLDILDIDVNGLPMKSDEYKPLQDVSAKARDRFATYLIVKKLVEGDVQSYAGILAEINNALGEDGQQVPISLDPLQESLKMAMTPDEPVVEPINISWPRISIEGDSNNFLSDQGLFYLTVRSLPESIQIFITGLKQKITLEVLWKEDDKYLVLRNVRTKQVLPAELMRDAQQANNPKRERSQVITQTFQLNETDRVTKDEEILSSYLMTLPVVKSALFSDSSDINEEKEIEVSNSFDLHRLWSTLVNAERDLHPTVTVATKPEKKNGNYYVQIEESLEEFGYLDSDDQIQLLSDSLDEQWNYGSLDLAQSKGDTLVINDARSMGFLRPGNQLKLVEVRSETSWQRRRKALHSVLQHETLIPDLVDWFDPCKPNPTPSITPLPTPDDSSLDSYGLDESKKAAFVHVLQKPLSVVMGPPGTGKTTMLSALLDYLSREPSVERILLVSQSHVAVNELAVRARQLMRKTGDSKESYSEPSMVRLGDKQKIDDELLDVHVESLQARYRTAFHRDLDARMVALASRLRLPRDLVAEAGDLYRRFGPELYQFIKAKDELFKLQVKMDELEEQRRPKKQFDRTRKRLERLTDALNHGLQAYVELPTPILDSEDPISELLAHIGEKHQVRNPKALSRLKGVIDVSNNWMLRLAADADGFAGFAARTRKLVIGTLVGIGKGAYNLSQNTYDVAIIDEAGRATASELSIAMQSARRVILVGDHKQLPPLTDHHLVNQVSKSLNVPKSEVVKTDFERAFLSTDGVMLTTQYRMAPPIGNLISHVFYDNELITGRGHADKWMNKLPSPWQKTVTWLDTSELREDKLTKNGNSRVYGARNTAEVDLICTSLRKLAESEESLIKLHEWNSKDNAPPIGIITGYRHQVNAIRERLDTDTWASGIRSLVRIDTIDSYQGSENRIIILSLVRNNSKKDVGFVDDAPRVNVAISRAKERLLILGASKIWSARNEKSPLGNVFRYIQSQVEAKDSEYQQITPRDLKDKRTTKNASANKMKPEVTHD